MLPTEKKSNTVAQSQKDARAEIWHLTSRAGIREVMRLKMTHNTTAYHLLIIDSFAAIVS